MNYKFLNRHHQNTGMFNPRCAQTVWAAGIAKVALNPQSAHQLNGFDILIQHHRLEPGAAHNAGHDLPKPAAGLLIL